MPSRWKKKGSSASLTARADAETHLARTGHGGLERMFKVGMLKPRMFVMRKLARLEVCSKLLYPFSACENDRLSAIGSAQT